MSFVCQTSEIGRLNTVILHRPGNEISSIIPEYLEEMLAEDTPHLPTAQREHDRFAAALVDNGTRVLYIADLFGEVVCSNAAAREEFIKDYVFAACMRGDSLRRTVTERLLSVAPQELFDTVSRGVRRGDLPIGEGSPLTLRLHDPYPFVIDPIPNLYFTRDIGVFINNGLSISTMSKRSRKPETLILEYIYRYHPLFTAENIPLWHGYGDKCEIEGGDILVLSDKVLAIGCGERTTASAVENLATMLFENGYERILVFNNPRSRRFMHLDVLCTMVDRDTFLVDNCITDGTIEIYEVKPSKSGLSVSLTTDGAKKVFARALSLPSVRFISPGENDPMTGAREQWNMGCNTLALSPGKVVAYDRNDVTNELMEKNGITVVRISGSELSRGRGGPRCMSLPVNRDTL